jgi:hypothetical protein
MRNAFLMLILATLVACSTDKAKTTDNLKTFWIENERAPKDLEFKLPKSFVNVRELSEDELMDTTDLELNWILDMQYGNQKYHCLFDSLDKRLNIIINSGPRLDIDENERKRTIFTVPALPLDYVLPDVFEGAEIVYESGEKRYNENTYYKRIYRENANRAFDYQIYFITTRWQSAMVIVRSPIGVNVDKYILTYGIFEKGWSKEH